MAKIEDRHREATEKWWRSLDELIDVPGDDRTAYAQALADQEAEIAGWLEKSGRGFIEHARKFDATEMGPRCHKAGSVLLGRAKALRSGEWRTR